MAKGKPVKEMTEGLALQLTRDVLDELAYTAAVRDLEAHAACMSRQLTVLGVPGVETMDYRGWLLRRRTELTKPLLFSLSYREPRVIQFENDNIVATVREVLKALDGTVVILDKEIRLAHEQDGHWRIRQEHVRNAQRRKH